MCEPASELAIAERWYRQTALDDLLGVAAEKVNDDRLYRAMDRLLPHKPALERHLKDRLGQLFAVTYDLLLYDVTSTYFEGEAEKNPMARRGHSRDHRPDCKQVVIALVVTKQGIALGYEVFNGNRVDVTTVQEVVGTMEARFGVADRVKAHILICFLSYELWKTLEQWGRFAQLTSPGYRRALVDAARDLLARPQTRGDVAGLLSSGHARCAAIAARLPRRSPGASAWNPPTIPLPEPPAPVAAQLLDATVAPESSSVR